MKIIVLTPVKNEAWILNRFLSVCSQFADYIIIADQNSTDGSREIYKQFSKVVMVDNKSGSFNEDERQLLLIQKARELIQGPKILLALDADEILVANAMKSAEWQTMLLAKPGTVLYFEKPDLYYSTDQCLRWRESPWPLGYVDDGIEHQPSKVHSIRIPNPYNARKLIFNDIKVMHYAYVRPASQNAKVRFYSVVENNLGTLNFIRRRYRYSQKRQWNLAGKMESSLPEWFDGWKDKGIDMSSIQENKITWYDLEVLSNFKRYGYKKYWLDDIWDINWSELAKKKSEYCNLRIKEPPFLLTQALKFIDKVFRLIKSIL